MVSLVIRPKGKVFEGKAPGIIREELNAAMYEATMFMEREVKERTPQGVYGAQGGLLSTIHGEVVSKGDPVKGVIGHQSKYGDVIEKGRRPGKPPPPEGSLIRWIEVKLGHGADISRDSDVDDVHGYAKQIRRIEFLIRRKIGRKGFEGVHMFERAAKENFNRIVKIFARRGFSITARLNN